MIRKFLIIGSWMITGSHLGVGLALTLLLDKATMKVLIIDKDRTVRQSLSYFMERHKNYDVVLADSKKEGISLFETTPFDMVLCGDRLPDGNGLEILKKLLRQNPNLISILMTVHSDELSKQDAMRAGIRGYLEKPFDLEQLEEAMCMLDCGLRNEE